LRVYLSCGVISEAKSAVTGLIRGPHDKSDRSIMD
jgi:hypothetical protein